MSRLRVVPIRRRLESLVPRNQVVHIVSVRRDAADVITDWLMVSFALGLTIGLLIGHFAR